MALPSEEMYYTFADALAWDEDVRAEIIDGKVYMMSTPLYRGIRQKRGRALFCRMAKQGALSGVRPVTDR